MSQEDIRTNSRSGSRDKCSKHRNSHIIRLCSKTIGSFSDLAESPDICHKTFALACVQSASTPVHVAHLDLEAS